ncbi:DUF2325 domain-containing protein [Herbaspirillum autotrophicum]|uniref:DUF2325 domain-containing protein n=1 Tax=Herbaspirillum autotrophicum TaxID=180195 RepID=UPI00067CBEAC|nr:DUF2325 domain-containing protein [Herbaspirillum autotrophicum]
MNHASDDVERLQHEHLLLCRQYGALQKRCTEQLDRQRAEIRQLQAELMKVRATVVVRDTTLAFAREDQARLQASLPGLPKRQALVRRVDSMSNRIQELMRECLYWRWQARPQEIPSQAFARMPATDEMPSCVAAQSKSTCAAERDATAVTESMSTAGVDDLADLEASLVAADLVICQTGCLSHGDYWRVQDHCKRTGKACVVAAQPDSVRIVRIHSTPASSAAPGRPSDESPMDAFRDSTPV